MQTGPHQEAHARLKVVAEIASTVQVASHVKATQYFRSGRELLRSAENYFDDGNPENAYILYIRFLTIFVEKITCHPEYKTVPISERKKMKEKSVEVFEKAERVKATLLERYEREHEEYKERLRLQEEAKRKAQEDAKRKATSIQPAGPSTFPHRPQGAAPQPDYIIAPSAPKANSQGGQQDDFGYVERSLGEMSISDKDNTSYEPESFGGTHPQFDRNTKPFRFLSPNSTGLRQVIVPGDIVPAFLRLSERNTLMNVETCGFLTGRIQGGKLVVTDLIIPKQSGTSDSCTTRNEEEYLVIQDKYDLITLGWIHTHPSQTAFLSSIDMHTHFSYQSMMPEAIAIVCAPSKNEVGTFMLTPSEGMEIIGSCRKTDFHPHPNAGSPLFMEAAHHTFDQSKSVRVHDLR